MKNVKAGHTKPIVCLDAGHYGKYNRSPVVPAYYESTMVWALHNYLAAELEGYGIQVKKTRANQEKDLALVARGEASKGCDLFLSIHSNAADSESVDYVVAMHQVDDNCGPIDDQSRTVARLLADCVAKIMGAKPMTWSTESSTDRDGNGYKDDYYGVLRGAHNVGTAGVIIEHGFHTNTAQATWLLEDSNLRRLAEAEAAVIAAWFDVSKAEEKPAAPEPEHWYRIREAWDEPKTQKGAYKNLDLAKENCPEGYSVYNWNGECVYYNGGGEFVTDAREIFITELQQAIGAAVDGIAGPETLSKTPTLSSKINARHAAVRPVQAWLYALGYHEVGVADGIAGPKFTSAVAHFQQDNGCEVDGEITERNKTWRKLLGLE